MPSKVSPPIVPEGPERSEHITRSITGNMSSGRLLRSKKLVKEDTVSTNKHRFESFNQRIAKLHIDPIRRRYSRIQEQDLSENGSHFATSLGRWQDLNLSESFSSFVREITPLCQSLPQVVHFEEHIFDILSKYISKQDIHSLEPLLDLLSSFARDIGVRFEVYFPRAVALLSLIAANHTEIEAIEWSFTSLTWLFKYLSRLLVPNLRPLFQIMAPLLKRETRKIHITRFAAEALSFLVRRAATMYEKDSKPLNTVIEIIDEGLKESCKNAGVSSNAEQYKQGLMSLLTNAMKGIDKKLHSCGIHIYRCLLDYIMRGRLEMGLWLKDVLQGTTIALIHHSDAEGLQPVLNLILQRVQQFKSSGSGKGIEVVTNLLLLLSSVRHGSRIRNWEAMLDAGTVILNSPDDRDRDQLIATVEMVAVILQTPPYDVVLPYFGPIMGILTDDRYEKIFLPFCIYFNELGHERFQNLLMPYFSKFITLSWEKNLDSLLLSIPKLIESGSRQTLTCPRDWQRHALQLFRDLGDHQEGLVRCFHFLKIIIRLSDTAYFKSSVSEILQNQITSSLHSCSSNQTDDFMLGSALKFYIQDAECRDAKLKEWWPLLCETAKRRRSFTPLLEAIFVITQTQDVWSWEGDLHSLINELVDNLHSSSHILRSLSLDILDQLCSGRRSQVSQVLKTALSIERSPLTLQSVRFISMQTRKLASQYTLVASDEILGVAIPHFCFGMLSFKLSQCHEDALAALKMICETDRGKSIVSNLSFDWLQRDSLERGLDGRCEPGSSRTTRTLLTEFECSNLNHMNDLVQSINDDILNASDILKQDFLFMNSTRNWEVEAAQVLALRVLARVPYIAEKHSRDLVPLFLSWATNEKLDHDKESSDNITTLGPDDDVAFSSLWRLSDRKSMLMLLGQFVRPQDLYKSNEVYAALVGLLCNGDHEVQRLALKAIFTWKLKEIQPYQESLLNLLDDTRFRDEITSFVNLSKQMGSIQDDHHAVLMPVLIRLLYGRTIARSRKSGKQSQVARRKAVLGSLCCFDDLYIAEFVHISLRELGEVKLLSGMTFDEGSLTSKSSTPRRRLGVLKMIESMLEELSCRLQSLAHLIIEAILDILICSIRQLATGRDLESQQNRGNPQISLLKAIRQKGMQSLNLTARCFAPEVLKPYLPLLFREILSPRMDTLAVETSQSISSTMQLFSTWASYPQSVHFLVDFDSRTLNSITDCLITSSSKEEVKLFVLDDILLKIVACLKNLRAETSPNDPSHGKHLLTHPILQHNGEYILQNLGSFLSNTPSKEALAAGIRLISGLAAFIKDSPQIRILLDVTTSLLEQRSIRLAPKSKAELIRVLECFLPLVKHTLQAEEQNKIYHSISPLFSVFKDWGHRLALGRSFQALATGDNELQRVSSLCQGLNAYNTQKIDEPDFDERLKAFNLINEELYKYLTVKEWRPLLFNMLYYVKDGDELAIRSNASFSLRRFIEATSLNMGQQEQFELVQAVLLPSVRKGASESSELIRTEFLAILAHLVRYFPQWEEVSDLRPLLVGSDEEASFFANILHIQHHRRLRALRRLATEAKRCLLNSMNVAHFLIPLIEHFIFLEASDGSALDIRAEALRTIGQLVPSIKWPQYKALYKRYSSYIQSQSQPDKIVFKLLGELVGALIEKSVNIDDKDDGAQRSSTLASTMPKNEKFADEIADGLLPCLMVYLHEKDESTVSLRVPVAVTISKLLKLLPANRIEEYLPSILTDVCNILRSRAQESRDLARETLVEILVTIGPSYFGFVLKQLRSALSRGYQLHVLSFTVHSILIAASKVSNIGDLDYSIPQVVAIIMDDTFGATGQEKDAEDYISRMKEVKSSKSFGTMELLAKITTVEHLAGLIKPFQALLLDKFDFHMVKKIEELLKRIEIGLSRNEGVADQRILIFCHEIIQEAYSPPTASHRTMDDAQQGVKYLAKSNSSKTSITENRASFQRHRFFRFALDTLRTVLHKYGALQTPENLYKFVPVVGDALTGINEELQLSALRLLTTIIKVPLKSIDDNAPIYVAECAKIIKKATSTNSDLTQSALKLVSAILRERRTIEINDGDLACLLQKAAPDLDEPDKQGMAFNFLKAIMNRKIVISEIYMIMDSISVIMVTNQTKNTRDMARGAYIHFLMDYPQSKDRLSKQVGFLVRNLEYKYPEGRQSVMEAIHLLFTKVGNDLAQNILSEFFVPLVMVTINDESSNCRQMAVALLRTLFEHCADDLVYSIHGILKSWLKQAEQPLLNVAAFQCYSIYLDSNRASVEKEIPGLLLQLTQALDAKLQGPSEADWELIYYILQGFSKICDLAPTAAFAASWASSWANIRQCLTFPHGQVKSLAAKLLGIYFADFATFNADRDSLCLPLRGSNLLWLNEEDLLSCTKAHLSILELDDISRDLANQSVRNLVFLGKVMNQTSMFWFQPGLETAPSDIGTSEEDDSGEQDPSRPNQKLALSHLIYQSCKTLRRPPIATHASSLIRLEANLQLLATLINHIPPPNLRGLLSTIIFSLYNFTDPAVSTPVSSDPAFNDGYKALASNASTLMSNLQETFGTTDYINVYQGVRERVKKRRDSRRTKRAIERITDPEVAELYKRTKSEKKKGKRKEKSDGQRRRRRGW